jgi:hypothetical protein
MSVWKKNFKSIKEYYASIYPIDFYQLDSYQLQIDPDETQEQVEAYSVERQQEEIYKCTKSFSYFCHKYIRILHPTKGLVPFVVFKYQNRVISDYENHRFSIISKFRQGGLTTVTLLYGLHKTLFTLDYSTMLISKSDREAVEAGYIVDRAVEYLPQWLTPKKDGKWNDHLKQITETGGSMRFFSPEAARGKSVAFICLDEAAFLPDLEKDWRALYPVLSTGGSCSLVSTVNGTANYYYELYMGAKEGRNKFHIIDIDYDEHPYYNSKVNPEWAEEQKAQLGEKGFLQEILRVFLGSGDTYIPGSELARLDQELKQIRPKRKLFAKYQNKDKNDDPTITEDQKGALWIWEEPITGHEYIFGIDCSEGVGADNSCIEIIDVTKHEQVGEFYSNNITPYEFAQVVYELAIFYNNALLVIEEMSAGLSVINTLQNELYYDNFYYNNTMSKTPKAGLKTTVSNRPLILTSFQTCILQKTMKMNSIRMLNEMKTFEYNATTKKPEAHKGKHDDAIMAFAIALYVMNSQGKNLPAGYDGGKKTRASSFIHDIKNELNETKETSIFDSEDENPKTPEMQELIELYRPNHAIMKEFGWIFLLTLLGLQ